MKPGIALVLFSALVCTATGLGTHRNDLLQAQKSLTTLFSHVISDPATQKKVGRIFSLAFLKRIQENSAETSPKAELPICLISILPDLPAKLSIPDLTFNFREDSESSGLIKGQFHTCDVNITGLDSIKDCVTLDLPAELGIGSLGLNLTTGTVGLGGHHSTGMELLIGILQLTGFGAFNFELINLEFGVKVDIHARLDGMDVTGFHLDLGFGKFSVSSDETIVNGKKLSANDWAALSFEVKDAFDTFWPPIVKPLLEVVVRDALDELLKDCLLLHFIPNTPNFLKCINPSLLSSANLEAELKALSLPPFETRANECASRVTLPPSTE